MTPAGVPADDQPALVAHRILTLSADMGGGHDATAAALEAAVQRLWPDSELRRLDTLAVLGPGVGRAFRSIYVNNVEHTPWLYEFFYASLWRHRWFASASKRFTGSWGGRRLAPEIDRFDPDVVLSTYPLGTAALGWLRRHRGLAVPSAAYVSDFAPHPFWINADVDANFVMHPAALPAARAAAANATVRVSGAPVLARFHPGDMRAARAATGIRADAFVILVSCGAYAFGRLERTVRVLTEADPRVQVVVTCGRNTATLTRLQAMHVPPARLMPLGWTDDMPSLVQAADLVLTNAGGATALEALACGRPVLMYQPIAAHGHANAVLMAVSGLAHVCSCEQDLVDQVRSAIAHPESLAGLASAARAHVGSHDLTVGLREVIDPASRAGVVTDRPWPMRPADAFFVHTDRPPRPQVIGAVLELGEVRPGQPLTAARLRAVIEQRITTLTPLRRRLVRAPRPGWILQSRVDVGEHIDECWVGPAAIPPSSVAAALDRFWSQPLPPDRPGWQLLLVHDPVRVRTTLAVKLHHAQADGVSALGLLDRLLDAAPHAPLVEWGRFRHRSGEPAPVDLPGSRVEPDRARSRLERAGLVARGFWSLAARGRPPRHPLNDVPDGPERRFVCVPVPAGRLEAAARRLGVRPHELVLALIADALGRLLGAAGLLRQGVPLRVMVPVSTRSVRLDRIFGNWAGSVAVDLPTDPLPIADRVAAIRAQLRDHTRAGEPSAGFAAVQGMGHAPVRLQRKAVATGYGARFFSAIVAYLPAARSRRWCAGAAVRAVYPVLPLASGVPVTVGAIRFADTIGIGVLFDAELGDRTAPALAADRVRAAVDAAMASLPEGAG